MSDTDALDDRNILARTAWGEARGIGREGMQATLNVIQNRLKSKVSWWGITLRSICLKPLQFSCWNANDPNRLKLLAVDEGDPQFVTALDLADKAISDQLPDITCGSTNYFNCHMKPKPKWCNDVETLAVIGPHWYFVAK